MQSIFVSIIAMAGVAFAAPAEVEARTGSLCPSLLYSNPQCCNPNVLNVLDLDCKEVPNAWNFKGSCASIGKAAQCCTIPVAGQGVLCKDALV
ncbi:hypothetical protein E4U55_006649 [Claviceps digitariae]|nr:hypothetical protein E4U55_006649 [Claviceps digitariae]